MPALHCKHLHPLYRVRIIQFAFRRLFNFSALITMCYRCSKFEHQWYRHVRNQVFRVNINSDQFTFSFMSWFSSYYSCKFRISNTNNDQISLFVPLNFSFGISSEKFSRVFFFFSLFVSFLISDLLYLQDLLRSDLPDAIEKALHGDERYFH